MNTQDTLLFRTAFPKQCPPSGTRGIRYSETKGEFVMVNPDGTEHSIGAAGADGASDVSELTATGMEPGSFLRVTASEGLEERTAAQVLSDIGGAAASHAASHAGASSTTLVPMSVVGGTGGVIVSSTQTIPPGVYTAKLTNTAKATASPGYNATLSLAGDVSWGTPGSGLNAALYSATDLRFSTASTTAPEACTLPLTVAAETNLTISGAMGAEADTATFTLELVTAAGTDPITIRSDQILDGNTPGNVAKLGSTGTLPIANGGTGAATAPLARAALGITEYGDPVVTATSKGAAQTAIGIVNMTPAAYTALVVAGTVDATTLYLLTE